jgi:hypothetical protein
MTISTGNTGGPGTISTTLTSNAVAGSNTTFLITLNRGSELLTSGNVYLGTVQNITSNTALTLITNATTALTNQTYRYNRWYQNTYKNIWSNSFVTTGNITTYSGNGAVTGIGTKFITDCQIGNVIQVPNVHNNTYGINDVIGLVAVVVTDTLLYVQGTSGARVSNLQYFSNSTYDVQDYTNTLGSIQGPEDISDQLSVLNGHLYDWTTSGLIPNLNVIHSYHPPLQDPVTGIAVNLPATYANTFAATPNNISAYNHGQGLGVTSGGVSIENFEHDGGAFGPDIKQLHNNLINSTVLKNVTNADTDTYNKNIKNVIPSTTADTVAQQIGATIPRVTDDHKTAQTYFSQVSSTVSPGAGINLGSNQDFNLRLQSPDIMTLRATGAPIAIPGVLNATVSSYAPTSPDWQPPALGPSPVSIRQLVNSGLRGNAISDLYSITTQSQKNNFKTSHSTNTPITTASGRNDGSAGSRNPV